MQIAKRKIQNGPEAELTFLRGASLRQCRVGCNWRRWVGRCLDRACGVGNKLATKCLAKRHGRRSLPSADRPNRGRTAAHGSVTGTRVPIRRTSWCSMAASSLTSQRSLAIGNVRGSPPETMARVLVLLRQRVVWLRQGDARVGGGEVLRKMLAERCGDGRSSMPQPNLLVE